MKVRIGFVSNSSSSSFCLFGAYIKNEDIMKVANTDETEDIYELCEIITEKTDLKFEGRFDDYAEPCFGYYPNDQKEDETKAQFRERTEKALSELFGRPVKASYHTDGWFNG